MPKQSHFFLAIVNPEQTDSCVSISNFWILLQMKSFLTYSMAVKGANYTKNIIKTNMETGRMPSMAYNVFALVYLMTRITIKSSTVGGTQSNTIYLKSTHNN